jgi:uncharacterized protein YndB with AHSA1/START domain
METAVMKAYMHAPAERVWEAIADHEALARFASITSVRLLRPGHSERNGEGARREVYLDRARYVEDIVRFEPPRTMEYKMVDSSLPLEHDIGRITLVPRGDGTEIHWTTRFRVKVPIIGGPLTKLFRILGCDRFHAFLLELKDELEADRS